MPSLFEKIQNKQNPSQTPREPDSSKKKSPLFIKAQQKVQEKKTLEPRKEENENDLDRDIERNIARQTSLGISTAAGLPGDLESFGRYLLDAEKETFLPTSSQIQGKIEEAGQGYLTPQSEFEKESDDLMKDIYSFSIGGGKQSLARNIGIPLVTNGLDMALDKLGASEKTRAYTKAGSMMIMDLLHKRVSNGGAGEYAASLYKDSLNAIPPNATTSARNLVPALNALEKNISSGGTAAYKTAALTKLKELKKAITRGQIKVEDLVNFRKTINKIEELGGGFEFHVSEPLKKATKANLDQVKKQVINTLDDYGRTNPQFGKLSRDANEAYAAYHGSNRVSNFLKDNFGDKIENGTVRTLLGLTTVGGVGAGLNFFPLATTAAVASLPLYQGIKIFQRVRQSPVLMKYYQGILTGALKQNVSQTAHNIEKFEAELKKEEEEQQKRILHLKRGSEKKKQANTK